MIAGAHNADYYPVWIDYIQSEETKDAFRYIVGLSACLTQYQCYPQYHGAYKDYRFFDLQDEQPFAFGLAQHWLLFYFRLPAIRSKRYSFEAIAGNFDTASIKNTGEWSIRLKTIDDVQRLWALLKIE